ncbi:MAG: RHS repeat-associated core domain-containing protein, partial [Chloroflexi bacterium]|nr:RHS repeat-associated core domain-containing protein [Chloroflexota bacterium]
YTHDRNGNQTGRGSDAFTFNALNRMTLAVISSATSTYTYDGNGVRTQKVTGGVTTDYLQDVNGRLPRVAAEKVGSAWTYYLYGKNLIARRASDQSVQYYHFDGTGNVRAISNAAGAVTERYDYDAFGALRNTPLGATNDRRMNGEQFDAETGYTHLRARQYDPALGRFTGVDAIRGAAGSPQTFNRYAYAQNNPANRSDPSGMWVCTEPDATCGTEPDPPPGSYGPGPGSGGRGGSITTQTSTPPAAPPACVNRSAGSVQQGWVPKVGYSVFVPEGEWTYQVQERLGNLGGRGPFGGFDTGAAMVWNWMTVWVQDEMVFGRNLFRHESGHIFQQHDLLAQTAGNPDAALFAYRSEVFRAYATGVATWTLHDNWLERQANCYGGWAHGDNPPLPYN